MTTSTCIDHGKAKSLKKYGYASVAHKGRIVKLHRLVYCQHKGIDLEAIAGQMVLHSCDNPRCVNPDHLRLGTHAENMLDRSIRNRVPGQKLTEQDVAFIRQHCLPGESGRGRGNKQPNGFKAIARLLNVSRNSVKRAYLGQSFKHLP